MATTAKGFPYPVGGDAPDGPTQIHALATAVDAAPGISLLTYAAINALAGGDLWDGRRVYQTNTGTNRPVKGEYTYNGVNWRLPWNMPWGEIAYAETTSLAQNIGTSVTDIIGVTLTATVADNRILEVRGRVGLIVQNTNPGLVKAHITTGANAGLATVCNKDCVATGRTSGEQSVEIRGASGSVTYKLRALTTSDTITVTGNSTDPGPCWIRLTDLGPDGIPA